MPTQAATQHGARVIPIPPPLYYAAALPQLPGEDAWQEREFLDALIPRASTVTIDEGQQLSLTVRVPMATLR